MSEQRPTPESDNTIDRPNATHDERAEEFTDDPTGDGGSLGVPATEAGDLPAGGEVERHEAVSGGGTVDRNHLDPEDSTEAMTGLD